MMKLLSVFAALLAASLLPAADGASRTTHEACEVHSRAHAGLLDSCFTVRRELKIKLNDKLRVHERALMDYSAGQVELLEQEKLAQDKRLVMDGDGKDMILSLPFSCDLLTIADEQLVLRASDEPEQAVFQRVGDGTSLQPIRWLFETTEKFLFKKFRLRAEASYSQFAARECEREH
ncbi:MAG: hypothetical protein HKN06_05990 [Gammaproteobacteria bacterium]|nr:hypothetical protein [Gammaproteobacteria bacterium]